MFNPSNRANAIATYASIVLSVLIGLNMITSYFLIKEAQIDLKIFRLERFRHLQVKGNDQAILTFNLKADLTPAWGWNTKQMFLYVTAEYVTRKNAVNQRVIWDKIITSKKNSILNLKEEKSKYILEDQGDGLRNNQVNFTFSWNAMPVSGILWWKTEGNHVFTFPPDYTD
eukprot:TRINITY_DN7728_c0_g1_i1.p1 TRINITY_DN7728_c0_g1~~TRINITY_DN7728_c0_g1_i1.p1  ORF type:complete len:193 (-),score=40.92 TRINITY_DN7728_c0_g1_i1:33-545(-)